MVVYIKLRRSRRRFFLNLMLEMSVGEGIVCPGHLRVKVYALRQMEAWSLTVFGSTVLCLKV